MLSDAAVPLEVNDDAATDHTCCHRLPLALCILSKAVAEYLVTVRSLGQMQSPDSAEINLGGQLRSTICVLVETAMSVSHVALGLSSFFEGVQCLLLESLSGFALSIAWQTLLKICKQCSNLHLS